MRDKTKLFEMKNIGNYYGGLRVMVEKGKYYWSIEDYQDVEWEEIPKSLYTELEKFYESQITQK